ncbi:hypothetical protein MIR68_010784 [Amoeboaphelidium protococcarum]|nr:hypothetical protein MIR68_010784 [Amoeboaphelidium protococcarum]
MPSDIGIEFVYPPFVRRLKLDKPIKNFAMEADKQLEWQVQASRNPLYNANIDVYLPDAIWEMEMVLSQLPPMLTRVCKKMVQLVLLSNLRYLVQQADDINYLDLLCNASSCFSLTAQQCAPRIMRCVTESSQKSTNANPSFNIKRTGSPLRCKCGGTDHQRISSKKCPLYKPRLKYMRDGPDPLHHQQTRTSTVNMRFVATLVTSGVESYHYGFCGQMY